MRSLRLSLLAGLVVSTSASAQAVVSAVLDAQGVSDANVRKAQRATEAVLRQVGGLSVGEGAPFKRGAPRDCADDCASSLVRSLAAPGVALLDLREAKGDKLSFELSLWLEGERIGSRRGEGPADALEASLKSALEGLLPAWARKGWGGIRVDVEPGTVVKVDGRAAETPSSGVLAVPAGPHHVDVVFADGHAVLQRLDVAEGSRTRLDATTPAGAVSTKLRIGTSPLRTVSYIAWMTGAATASAGVVAGALSRGTAAGMAPCSADSRSCATLADALERQRQAQSLASTGNVLIGVGSGLAALGAVLFTVDAVAAP